MLVTEYGPIPIILRMQSLHSRASLSFFFNRWLPLSIGFSISVSGAIQSFLTVRTSLPPDMRSMAILAVMLFVPAVAVGFVVAVLEARSYAYDLREDVLYKASGVLTKKYTSIPYDRIQNVDIVRDVFDRLLGLSHVRVETAGSIALEGSLPGLGIRDAEQLRDALLARAKKK